MANFTGTQQINMTSQGSESAGYITYLNSLFDATLSWKDVDWLKSLTQLPIILKGILHPFDAIEALKHRVDAIIVSNHGGRQLDSVPAAIEVLPMIAKAVAGRCDVANVIAAKGEVGVRNVLNMLNTELDATMALAGYVIRWLTSKPKWLCTRIICRK